MLSFLTSERKLQSALSLERYIHTMGVVKEAKKLAERYNADIEKASYAALLHQFLGAEVAKREYLVEDEEILNAIKYHTTGKPDMTLLEKIVFIADYI